jgi:hypothetical protein
MTMRKRIINKEHQQDAPDSHSWLDVEQLAQVEVTSENADYPIESAFVLDSTTVWRAEMEGKQIIRLLFDSPQTLSHIRLKFDESSQQRTQEYVLKWSSDKGISWHEIVRQQYHFSPPDTVCEIEDYHVDLQTLTSLELMIIPEISGGGFATLSQMRIA